MSGLPGLLPDSLEPELFLPEQTDRREADPPEIKLMKAVLEDALAYALDLRPKQDYETARARRWIQSGHARFIYDFEVICEYLDLDAETIRRRVGAAHVVGTFSRRAHAVISFEMS